MVDCDSKPIVLVSCVKYFLSLLTTSLTMTVPVQAGDILVAGHLLALHLDAMFQDLHRGVTTSGQVPYPGGAVSTATGQQIRLRVPSTNEHFTVMTLESISVDK